MGGNGTSRTFRNCVRRRSAGAHVTESRWHTGGLAPPCAYSNHARRVASRARNEYPQVIAYTTEVLAQAKLLGDELLVATPSAQMGAVLSLQGHFRSAEALLRRGIALTENAPDRWEWSWCVGFLGIGLAMRGQVQQGLAEVEHAIALMQARQNTVSVVQILVYRLIVYLQLGDLEELVPRVRL